MLAGHTTFLGLGCLFRTIRIGTVSLPDLTLRVSVWAQHLDRYSRRCKGTKSSLGLQKTICGITRGPEDKGEEEGSPFLLLQRVSRERKCGFSAWTSCPAAVAWPPLTSLSCVPQHAFAQSLCVRCLSVGRASPSWGAGMCWWILLAFTKGRGESVTLFSV